MRPPVAWFFVCCFYSALSLPEMRREKDAKPQWGHKSSDQRTAALSANGQVEHRQRWGLDDETMVQRIKRHRLEEEEENKRHEEALERDLRKDGYPVAAAMLKKYQHQNKEAGSQGAMTELLRNYENAQHEVAALGELLEKSAGDIKSTEFEPAVDAVHHFLEHHPILSIVCGILLGVTIGLACLVIYHLLKYKKLKSLRLATQGVTVAGNTLAEKCTKAESASSLPESVADASADTSAENSNESTQGEKK